MKLKKLLVICLAVALIANSFAAFAKADGGEKTYNYVALGDSIAAGYSLSESGTLFKDPALVLTEALLANPINTAYPAVFGDYIKQLGAERGYTVNATNLSATAYQAQDVEKTILNEGYKGQLATYILEGVAGKGASAPLAKYHDFYDQYLTEADLVSIQLGGNDILMDIIFPMYIHENPFIRATAMFNMLILFGMDIESAAGAAYMIINNAKDQITLDTYKEAAAYIVDVRKNLNTYVENSANNVKKVVEAVQSVNSDAEIALVGMYNPYGNSLEYDGQIYNLPNVVKNIVSRTAKEVYGIDFDIEDIDPSEYDLPDIDFPSSPEEIEAYIAQLEKEIEELKQRLAELRDQYADENPYEEEPGEEDPYEEEPGEEDPYEEEPDEEESFVDAVKDIINQIAARINAIANIVSEETSYPLQYLIAGRSIAPQICLLNQKLEAIAEETGCTFVDVYGISNENNLDPHPTINGHREIADLLWAQFGDMISDRMPVEEESEPVESEEESSEAPAEEPTEAPVEESSEAPAENPTEAPVEESSEAPAESQAQTQPATQGGGSVVPTGDSSPVFFYTLLSLFAVLGMVVVVSFKKKEN